MVVGAASAFSGCYLIFVEFPSPYEIKEFIEMLDAGNSQAVLALLRAVEVPEKIENTSFYRASLAAAAAIFLEKQYEVWSAYVDGKRHYWVKLEGIRVDPDPPHEPALRSATSLDTQRRMREYILKAMKKARPQKRFLTESHLKANGWKETKIVQSLVETGNHDLAQELIKIVAQNKKTR